MLSPRKENIREKSSWKNKTRSIRIAIRTYILSVKQAPKGGNRFSIFGYPQIKSRCVSGSGAGQVCEISWALFCKMSDWLICWYLLAINLLFVNLTEMTKFPEPCPSNEQSSIKNLCWIIWDHSSSVISLTLGQKQYLFTAKHWSITAMWSFVLTFLLTS